MVIEIELGERQIWNDIAKFWNQKASDIHRDGSSHHQAQLSSNVRYSINATCSLITQRFNLIFDKELTTICRPTSSEIVLSHAKAFTLTGRGEDSLARFSVTFDKLEKSSLNRTAIHSSQSLKSTSIDEAISIVAVRLGSAVSALCSFVNNWPEIHQRWYPASGVGASLSQSQGQLSGFEGTTWLGVSYISSGLSLMIGLSLPQHILVKSHTNTCGRYSHVKT